MKVVINKCHGGFGLSEPAMYRYAEIKGLTLYPEKNRVFSSLTTYWITPRENLTGILEGDDFNSASQEAKIKSNEIYRENVLYDRDIPRDDLALIQVVEELGDAANARHAELEVVEIPDGTRWQVEEYDGLEWIAEKHRTWQ